MSQCRQSDIWTPLADENRLAICSAEHGLNRRGGRTQDGRSSEAFTVVAARIAAWARGGSQFAQGMNRTGASTAVMAASRGRILRRGPPRTSVLYTTAAEVQANRRISGSRITMFALGGGEGEMVR